MTALSTTALGSRRISSVRCGPTRNNCPTDVVISSRSASRRPGSCLRDRSPGLAATASSGSLSMNSGLQSQGSPIQFGAPYEHARQHRHSPSSPVSPKLQDVAGRGHSCTGGPNFGITGASGSVERIRNHLSHDAPSLRPVVQPVFEAHASCPRYPRPVDDR